MPPQKSPVETFLQDVEAQIASIQMDACMPHPGSRHTGIREELRAEKLSEQLTDQAGRFPRGGPVGPGMHGESNGERHNIQLEIERRVLKLLAEKVNTLLRRDDVNGCYFAANNEINRHIIDHLTPQARAKIEKNVTANLTKIDKGELLRHF